MTAASPPETAMFLPDGDHFVPTMAAQGPWDPTTAHGGPVAGSSRRYNTWYRPLEDQDSIDRAVHWVLGRKDLFLITSGDMDLFPLIVDAGGRFRKAPPDEQMAQMVSDLGMQPLFT